MSEERPDDIDPERWKLAQYQGRLMDALTKVMIAEHGEEPTDDQLAETVMALSATVAWVASAFDKPGGIEKVVEIMTEEIRRQAPMFRAVMEMNEAATATGGAARN